MGFNMAYTYKLKSRTFSVVCEPLGVGAQTVTSPSAAGPVLRSIFADLDDYQEHFVIVALNAKGRVIGHKVLASGTETACLVSPAMIFRAALVLGGTTVIMCHNHPSGDPNPSREDISLTRRCVSAGETLGLPVADHIILGSETIHSFRSAQGWEGV